MKTWMREKETLGLLLFAAIVEAIGGFLLICGMLQIRIEEIGTGSSIGYIVGIAGVFFTLMLLFHSSKSSKF